MTRKNYRRTRNKANRKILKTLFVCGEGETENKYFNHLSKKYGQKIHIKCLESTHSSPNHVLNEMENFLQVNALRDTDEAWLVVDRDSWTDSQFMRLRIWSENKNNQNVAISNPKFEFWLLLHFDDGNKIANGRQCDNRLVQKLAVKDIRAVKNPNPSVLQKFNEKNIEEAIDRAKKRLVNCEDSNWPTEIGTTTVHLLVEKVCSA